MTVNTNPWNRLRYTLYAPVYDRVVRFGRARARSIELLRLQPGERVLIDGAGPGADLDYLPPDVDVVATDLTPAMVARTAKRAQRRSRRVDARVMDAHSLDFPDASFDAVILHLILAVVPDPVSAIQEASRVLRPGGRVAVFDKFAPENARLSMLRRVVNPLTNALFTDVTRQLGPLLAGTQLSVEQRESAYLGGMFEVALLRKSGDGNRAA